MKKNLLIVGFLAFSLSIGAQNVVCHVDANGIFYVGENALVYNGGGVQTNDNGIYDIKGNVMIVGSAADGFKTLQNAGTAPKTTGGNFILRLNTPATYATSTYGQLYIDGLAQTNITGIVDKEFRTKKHGTYQQIALPFKDKLISSLSTEFGKTFSNIRHSQNEVLIYDNRDVIQHNYSISNNTSKNTSYYMIGSKNFDSGTPPAGMVANAPTPNGSVYTVKGIPFANGASEPMNDAGLGTNFGVGGNAVTMYNEKYNTYLQDSWDYLTNTSAPWTVATFGRNIYQFGNPYFTNLDLKHIGVSETGGILNYNDGNNLVPIKGIRFDSGNVVSESNGSTYDTGAQYINFTSANVPTGDLGIVIKPMQVFVVKLEDNAAGTGGKNRTLTFDGLRRFKGTPRAASTDYSVTSLKNGKAAGTVKQLGIIGLDINGQELARTYYVVYPDATSGASSNRTVQTTLGSTNILGTYEEDPINGGYDMNLVNTYWLYINEANEDNFFGKAVPLAMYSNDIKSLKFEVRENTELVDNNVHQLSTGVGFYYKAPNGMISEVAQNQVIPVTGSEYSLYYGKAGTLGTEGSIKPNRTQVVYSKAVDMFIVRFDPNWKKADIVVYDLSGKIVISQKEVSTSKDFELNLSKLNTGYIVTAVSEKGEKISSKIIR